MVGVGVGTAVTDPGFLEGVRRGDFWENQYVKTMSHSQ